MAGQTAAEDGGVDVKRTLKFVGRLAVRLQSNAGESADPQAIADALQEASTNLPEGVVKRTLESDIARFSRALVDRVASLQTVKEDSTLVATEQKSSALDLDGIAARDLVSNVGYDSAVAAIVKRWGGKALGVEEGELAKWRELSLRALAAKPVVPEALVAAYVKVESEIGRRKVGGIDGAGESASESSVAETVTSSVLQASSCLSSETRLLLISALTALLSKALETLSKALETLSKPSADLLNANNSSKRLHKLARALLTIHSLQLKQSSAAPPAAFRTGALLAVAVAVTKYLVLTKGVGGSLGDAQTTKLRQSALNIQAVLAAEVRGVLVGLLCSFEDVGSIQSLRQEGSNVVRGVLYEAALVGVPFERRDGSLGAWVERVKLAKRAVTLFRSIGERTRANTIVTAVLHPEDLSHVAGVARSRLATLKGVLPSEGLTADPRGFATWLVSSASDSAFAVAMAALCSDSPAAAAPDRNLETGPQESPPPGEAEPLFYIDKTGASDPTEERILAVVGQIARDGAASGERNGKRKAKNGKRKKETEGGSDDDVSNESGESASDGDESEESEGAELGAGYEDIREAESDGEAEADGEAGSDGSDEAEETGRVVNAEGDHPELERADRGADTRMQAVGGATDGQKGGGMQDLRGPDVNSLEEDRTSSDSALDSDGERDASRGEELAAPTTPREVGLPQIAVGKKKGEEGDGHGSGGEKQAETEGGAADDLSPLHTRSGRSVLASPGPDSVRKRKSVTSARPESAAKKAAGKSKATLSTVVETEAEANVGGVAKGGKNRLRTEGGKNETIATGVETNGAGGKELSGTLENATESEQPEVAAPATGRKRKQVAVEATVPKKADEEDYVSPLHTRSGKVVAAPSTVKKTASKKKRGPLDEVREGGTGELTDDVSPLHTRSGKAVGASATPAPATAKKTRAAATPAGGASAVKRTRKQ